MNEHSMDVVRKAVEHLNPCQTPVVTFDQLLFALVKQIPWKWPHEYGEEKFVVLFGGLHIEMAALKTLGCREADGCKHWFRHRLHASVGTAESFLQALHGSRTSRAHQATAAALFTLQQHAYNHYRVQLGDTCDEQLEFDDWCQQQMKTCPQFDFWSWQFWYTYGPCTKHPLQCTWMP